MIRSRDGRDLPWGWWLRATSAGFVDEQGRSWRSVREAFWQGRLGFPDISMQEQHELLLRVLNAIDGRWVGAAESKHDLFNGDMMFWRFYQCWLASIGLIAPGHMIDALSAPLSAEGRSVLLMLQATRQPDWEPLPFQEVIDAVAAAANGPAEREREEALSAFERQVGVRRHVFARERLGHMHLVTLTGISTAARMPTMRVMWSQGFADARARDDLFAWLAQRVDRWDDFGRLAYDRGANALTEHLLAVLVATATLS